MTFGLTKKYGTCLAAMMMIGVFGNSSLADERLALLSVSSEKRICDDLRSKNAWCSLTEVQIQAVQEGLMNRGFWKGGINYTEPTRKLIETYALWKVSRLEDFSNKDPFTITNEELSILEKEKPIIRSVRVSVPPIYHTPQDQIRFIQTVLAERGFYPNDQIDGKLGPLTEKAIRNFQRQNNIYRSGLPTMDLVRYIYNDFAAVD